MAGTEGAPAQGIAGVGEMKPAAEVEGWLGRPGTTPAEGALTTGALVCGAKPGTPGDQCVACPIDPILNAQIQEQAHFRANRQAPPPPSAGIDHTFQQIGYALNCNL